MSQKQIRRGDIVRIRHNNSGHQFKENTLCVYWIRIQYEPNSPTGSNVQLEPSGGTLILKTSRCSRETRTRTTIINH